MCNWIDIKERVPDKEGPYIVYAPIIGTDTSLTRLAWWCVDIHKWDLFSSVFIDSITHWTSLSNYQLTKEQKGNDEKSGHGTEFLNHIREIVNECNGLSPDRRAGVAAFSICVLIDGSGEACAPEYELYVRINNKLERVSFFHHDL